MTLKKMALMGAALCGTVFCGAANAEISSANVVGYSNQSLVDGKINMIGFGFQAVAGGDINLNNITGVAMTAGEDETCADQVLLWNASESRYTTYAYYDEGEGVKTWYDVFGDSEPEIPAGKAFWYQSYTTGDTAKNITVSGAVASEATTTITLVDGKINMIVNPYPVSFDLNDATTVELINCVAGEDETCADQVLVWNANESRYTTYAYYDEGEGAKTWYDVFGDSEPTIPAGIGFWYSAFKANEAGGKALKFIRPY